MEGTRWVLGGYTHCMRGVQALWPPGLFWGRNRSFLGKGPRILEVGKGGRMVWNTSCLRQGASQGLERSSGLINTGASARCIEPRVP